MDNEEDSKGTNEASQPNPKPKVIIEEESIEMRGPGGKVAVMVRRPHHHTKHNIGIQLQGPRPDGVSIDRVQLWLCPGCKLAWFEELEPVFPQVIRDIGRRAN